MYPRTYLPSNVNHACISQRTCVETKSMYSVLEPCCMNNLKKKQCSVLGEKFFNISKIMRNFSIYKPKRKKLWHNIT